MFFMKTNCGSLANKLKQSRNAKHYCYSKYELDVIRFTSVYLSNTKPDTSCSLWLERTTAKVKFCLIPLKENRRKVSFPGHNDTLPSSGTEPRVDSLVVTNLHSYPIKCTAASWDISVKRLSQRHTQHCIFTQRVSHSSKSIEIGLDCSNFRPLTRYFLSIFALFCLAACNSCFDNLPLKLQI